MALIAHVQCDPASGVKSISTLVSWHTWHMCRLGACATLVSTSKGDASLQSPPMQGLR